jgi:nucleoside 2-deoxyribosyltransferase
MKKLKAYLASPYGFSEGTRYFMAKVYVPALKGVVEIINPWDLISENEVKEAEKKGKESKFAMEIGKRNKDAIDSADIVIAALDGQEVDSGTSVEVGYAVGKGKKVYGYRTDFRQTGEKGATVNLQVQYFIESSGGRIVSNLNDLKKAIKVG